MHAEVAALVAIFLHPDDDPRSINAESSTGRYKDAALGGPRCGERVFCPSTRQCGRVYRRQGLTCSGCIRMVRNLRALTLRVQRGRHARLAHCAISGSARRRAVRTLSWVGGAHQEPRNRERRVACRAGSGNSRAARLNAFQVLLVQFSNVAALIPSTPGTPPESCGLLPGANVPTYDYDVGLSTAVVQQMMSVATTVYRAAGDDPVVRSAAFCVRQALHSSTDYPVNPSLITLSFVCGDRFRIHNGNAEVVPVTWNSYHVPASARSPTTILTSGGLSVAPNADAFFRTDSIATARLYYRTTLLQTRANGGTACH